MCLSVTEYITYVCCIGNVKVLVTCCSSVMNKDLTTSLNFSKLFEEATPLFAFIHNNFCYRPHIVLVECNDTVEEL